MKLLYKPLLVFGIFGGSFLLVSGRAAIDDGNHAEYPVEHDHLTNEEEADGIMNSENKKQGSADDDIDEQLKEFNYYNEVKVCAAYRKLFFSNAKSELLIMINNLIIVK